MSRNNEQNPNEQTEVEQPKVERRSGTKGKGTRKPRPDRTVQTNPGDNTKYISHSLRLAKLPKADLQNTESVRSRIDEYFNICLEDDMKPSSTGLAVAMGVSSQYLWAVRVGEKGKNPEVVELLKKAQDILESLMVDYMQNGKINPPSGIFIMKNAFQYKDEQKITVEPQSPIGDTKTLDMLTEQYKTAAIDTGSYEDKTAGETPSVHPEE